MRLLWAVSLCGIFNGLWCTQMPRHIRSFRGKRFPFQFSAQARMRRECIRFPHTIVCGEQTVSLRSSSHRCLKPWPKQFGHETSDFLAQLFPCLADLFCWNALVDRFVGCNDQFFQKYKQGASFLRTGPPNAFWLYSWSAYAQINARNAHFFRNVDGQGPLMRIFFLKKASMTPAVFEILKKKLT